MELASSVFVFLFSPLGAVVFLVAILLLPGLIWRVLLGKAPKVAGDTTLWASLTWCLPGWFVGSVAAMAAGALEPWTSSPGLGLIVFLLGLPVVVLAFVLVVVPVAAILLRINRLSYATGGAALLAFLLVFAIAEWSFTSGFDEEPFIRTLFIVSLYVLPTGAGAIHGLMRSINSKPGGPGAVETSAAGDAAGRIQTRPAKPIR
ncbi:MAG: hypothetical protein KIS96_04920 [Bauldia sp.]|nr:hypothetical protein [Bauldia sp.]